MQIRSFRGRSLVVLALVPLLACGARSSLLGPNGAGGQSNGTGGEGGSGGTPVACEGDQTVACGSDVGTCKKGVSTCVDGLFGPCEGATDPTAELCNGLDDNCDGTIDDGFHIGEACDGPDTDLCPDDVMTCNGCSMGPNKVELCNGLDDNCNGIIDADCEVGDCKPTLVVTGSTPSSPNCIDFPVEKGSTGLIQYPCGGGPVTAQLGSVQFSGSVTNGVVSLDGTVLIQGPDNCLWKTSHHISGTIYQGQLNYSYAEAVIDMQGQPSCWSPCTETGTVKIKW
jgi:hypothetical protein